MEHLKGTKILSSITPSRLPPHVWACGGKSRHRLLCARGAPPHRRPPGAAPPPRLDPPPHRSPLARPPPRCTLICHFRCRHAVPLCSHRLPCRSRCAALRHTTSVALPPPRCTKDPPWTATTTSPTTSSRRRHRPVLQRYHIDGDGDAWVLTTPRIRGGTGSGGGGPPFQQLQQMSPMQQRLPPSKLTRSTYPEWHKRHCRCNSAVGGAKFHAKPDGVRHHPRTLWGTISN
jgi:hypothetical protein